MRKYAGWLALVIPPVGGLLTAYGGYISAHSGPNDPTGNGLQIVLAVMTLGAGTAALIYTPFRSNITRWICVPFYVFFMGLAMLAIDLAINGFEVKVM
jgi:hypothetical protein